MLALIKLNNGQEVIGSVKGNSPASITLEDPLQINYRLVATQPMPTVSVSRYMPFSSDAVFTFRKEDLMHVVEPKPAMAEYYVNALQNYKTIIDGNIEEELLLAAGSEKEMQEDEEPTDAYKALLERINFKGPLN